MINVTTGLRSVGYANDEEKFQQRAHDISDAILKAFKNKSRPLPKFMGHKEGLVDIIVAGHKQGYAIAMHKEDEFIINHPWGEFSYRHREVLDVIDYIVERFDLETDVEYDRGMGVFVYNIWEKDVPGPKIDNGGKYIEDECDECGNMPEECDCNAPCDVCGHSPSDCQCDEDGEYEECYHCKGNSLTCDCYEDEDEEEEEGDED
jgi:hypothetical protein